MGNRRAVLVIVAVVLAIAAFGLAFIVLNNAQDEAKSNLKTVYVANQAIKKGTTIDKTSIGTLFVATKVESVPAGAVTDPSLLAGKITQDDLEPQQQILMSQFSNVRPTGRTSVDGNDVAAQLDADRAEVNEVLSADATKALPDRQKACEVAQAGATANGYELFVVDPAKPELGIGQCGVAGNPVQFVTTKEGKSGKETTTVKVTVGENLWQAVSFSVDQVKGVAGYIGTGDRINFMFATCDTEKTCSPPDRVVQIPTLGNVLVLRATSAATAVTTTTVAGATGTASPAAQASSGLITVRVSPQQAEQIALAMANNSIYLTLSPIPAPTPTTTTTANK